MKKLYAIIVILLYLFLMYTFIGCTTTKYVPIEVVKTEYKNKIEKDTLIVDNTKIIKEKGDTVYIDNTKYIYKTTHKTDTIYKTDTIPIIQEIEVIKEVNRLKDWQILLMVLGGGMVVIVGYKIFKVLKL